MIQIRDLIIYTYDNFITPENLLLFIIKKHF